MTSVHDPRSSIHASSPSGGAVSIRPLKTMADYAKAAELQALTWGLDYADIVPASVLKVAAEVGGITLGAFAPDTTMVGFVFGLTGPREGSLAHWSHMLAVRPRWRDQGIGRALKSEQASLLRARGVDAMLWTFDPLVARNAHFNLTRLGVQVERYVPDMYGATGSALHAFGTDRFVVRWSLDSECGPDRDALGRTNEETAGPYRRITIPRDIEAVHVSDPARALRWRADSRAAFTAALEEGYEIVGFSRADESDCHYLLRAPTP